MQKTLLFSVILSMCCAARAVTVTVGPGEPVKTISDALAVTRAATNDAERVIVVRGGDYYDSDVALDARDNGLALRAAAGETPVLWGGAAVRGWQKAGDRFYAVTVPQSVATNARALLVNGAMRPRARFPETGTFFYTNTCAIHARAAIEGYWERKPTPEEQTHLLYKREDIPETFDYRSADISAYHMWTIFERAIAQHDREKGMFLLSQETGNPLGAYGVKKYVLWNTVEGMTRPGQWYIDRLAHVVYYWPMPGEDMEKLCVVIPSKMTVLRIAGTKKAPAKNITVEGLSFRATTVPLVKEGWIASSYDGAVSVEMTEGVTLNKLKVSHVAGNGIRAMQGWNTTNTRLRILGCEVTQTGGGGIYAVASQSEVAFNRVTDVGRMFPSGVGINLGGAESVFASNVLANTTYSAMCGGGQKLLIEGNTITNYMTVLGDGAAIYIGSSRECVIRGNTVNDCGNPDHDWSAYSLDERCQTNVIEGNVSENVDWPVHNHIASNTVIRANVFRNPGDMKLTFQRSGNVTLENNTLTAGGSITVNNADGVRAWKDNAFLSGSGRVTFKCTDGVELPVPQDALGAGLNYINLKRTPDAVWSVIGGVTNALAEVAPRVWSNASVRVELPGNKDGTQVRVSAPGAALEAVVLRWAGGLPDTVKLLGDVWERSYGDLAWRPLAAARPMPWYFFASDGRVTHAYGVAVQPGALCCWSADKGGVTLALDVRAGGVGVRLGGRTLNACTVLSRAWVTNETPFQAAAAFCRQMCPRPRLPQEPVYGFNDWYCAYGINTGTNFLEDAAFITSLIPEVKNRPYLVMDDGWQVNAAAKAGTSGFGPWDRSNARFAMDMATFAKRVKALNAKPGLWYRPLYAWPEVPEAWRLKKARDFMDPTVPEVKRQIADDMARFRAWGFQLVKIDYLTFDMNNRWGFDIGGKVVHDDRAWADSSRTTAEVLLDLYRTMRQGAGDGVVIIGCNALSHLAAGVFELQRIGDDTSGLDWKRTRKYGVNTLAFRAAQDRAFYAADADCVGLASAGAVPWEKNRQWLDLVARSGTPLFVSWKRQLAGPEERKALREAFLRASQPAPTAEPLDWMESPTPKRWRFGSETVTYDWGE